MLRWFTIALAALLCSCYGAGAARQSERLVRAGFDFDARGPWILVSGPASLLLAGGNLALGSVVPLGDGVDPREPEAQWYRAYPGDMRAPEEVGILCHQDRATWVTGIRPAVGGPWFVARHERWHFPICLEVLPGDYEIEVHYFAREADEDREGSVSLQAESIRPSRARWQAAPGRLYLLRARLGPSEPSSAVPPQRHIPRSRAMGTTWWELRERDWAAEIDEIGAWGEVEGSLVDRRQSWQRWERRRDR